MEYQFVATGSLCCTATLHCSSSCDGRDSVISTDPDFETPLMDSATALDFDSVGESSVGVAIVLVASVVIEAPSVLEIVSVDQHLVAPASYSSFSFHNLVSQSSVALIAYEHSPTVSGLYSAHVPLSRAPAALPQSNHYQPSSSVAAYC